MCVAKQRQETLKNCGSGQKTHEWPRNDAIELNDSVCVLMGVNVLAGYTIKTHFKTFRMVPSAALIKKTKKQNGGTSRVHQKASFTR